MRHEHDPLNYPPVIPEAFKDSWQKTMELWGEQLLTTGETILEMIEEVFDTEPGYLRRYTRGGPHLLGPNAANLDVLTEPATIINLFHSDLNLLTLHGPATYPGLRIWLRNGTSLFVKIPPGHVLVQVGQQMEWLTGGVMEAGMHEVIVTREALQMRRFKSSPWRISLPCFMHSASDMTLQVMPEAMRYADVAPEVVRERERRYPPLTVGEQVERELRAIGLAAP
jgi:isopenicillin N synthase-like dioxygenase